MRDSRRNTEGDSQGEGTRKSGCGPDLSCVQVLFAALQGWEQGKTCRLHLVEPELEEDQVDAAAEFDDVEASLADHQLTGDTEFLNEDEAAEALAVTWLERRDINRLQRQRRFNDASGTKQSFRVEIEALKRRTRLRQGWTLGTRAPVDYQQPHCVHLVLHRDSFV